MTYEKMSYYWWGAFSQYIFEFKKNYSANN